MIYVVSQYFLVVLIAGLYSCSSLRVDWEEGTIECTNTLCSDYIPYLSNSCPDSNLLQNGELTMMRSSS